MGVEKLPRTIWWEVDAATGRPGVYLVDQTRLPLQGDILCCSTYGGICEAIRTMALRGAPALGVGAAFAVAIWSENESGQTDASSYLAALDAVADEVASVRPTAVNLSWGAHRVSSWAHMHADLPLDELKAGVVACAQTIRDDDEARCRAIGEAGSELFASFDASEEGGGVRILTHCNAGSLATAFYGTALGVIYRTHEKGRLAQVWVDETRPVNQGARLTAWELMMAEVPSVLICDDMAASVMAQGWVDAVVVGADRICANGDVTNKIGTYALAVLAQAHGIPFYVAAPTSTVDPGTPTGDQVVIEQRDPREMEGSVYNGIILPSASDDARALDLLTHEGPRTLDLKGVHQMVVARKGGAYEFDAWMRSTPPNVLMYNPAFDVTPARLVTAIVTENGVYAPGEVLRSIRED